MTRRQLLSLAGCCVPSAVSGRAQSASGANAAEADITLRIAEITLDLAPRRSVRTLAYNGQSPGPPLRIPEGKSIVVEVWNDTAENEMVHWHGFQIPADVDGAHEEGTPHIAPRDHRRYSFTARPSGTRWYHSHGHAGRNLHKNTYSGQFGLVVVEPASDPGRYDQEVPIILHEWEPYFTDDMDVDYKLFSINGKMLGGGEPIRVRQSQRVLLRVLNASATLTHRLALPGHSFTVIALDGNALPAPRTVPLLELAPAERVDALVEMDRPGVWILGETRDAQRNAGMGIAVEYAGESGAPRWMPPPAYTWDYTVFGGRQAAPEPDGRFPFVIKAVSGHKWMINGKSFPHTDPFLVIANRRYRFTFDNQTSEAHPIHLHRHRFEITRFAGKPTSGVFKDTVVVPAWREVEVDLVAANPGPTLMHCHQQLHMDEGFMAMLEYKE
ncbi:MAG TPA: multicopper oxidase family protein [Bryobacteraceae bacterium]|nr:multicopper oxidase family protein [Bryobacteraceae bacterium]